MRKRLHQNIVDVFLDIFASFQLGDRLEAYLTEEELERVGLWCHFALDCLLPSLEHACSGLNSQLCSWTHEHSGVVSPPFTRLVKQAFARQK